MIAHRNNSEVGEQGAHVVPARDVAQSKAASVDVQQHWSKIGEGPGVQTKVDVTLVPKNDVPMLDTISDGCMGSAGVETLGGNQVEAD